MKMTTLKLVNSRSLIVAPSPKQPIQSIRNVISNAIEAAKAATAKLVRTPTIVPKEWYL
jgi:hypothetical protein